MDQKKILIVDDNAVNRRILRTILESDYAVEEARDGLEALEILEEQFEEIAAITLDLVMPKMDGYEFLRVFRNVEAYKNIPVLVMTVNSAKENERRILELGAWDYILKPYDPDVVRLRLLNALNRSHANMMTQLQYRADFDILTGIYSKEKYFFETKRLLERHAGEMYVFVCMDVDRFQLINSVYGMKEGDRLLCNIANGLRLFASCFDDATYGRIENDVFSVCMPFNLDREEKLMQTIRQIFCTQSQRYDIIPSIGVYRIEEPMVTMNEMYYRASLAARRCKGCYVDFYAFYDENMSSELLREQEIQNDMSRALEHKQFGVYYQPKYDLKNKKPCGAEALVRWFHPMKGILMPDEFIPIFERNGFISKMDYCVWEQVCKQLTEWKNDPNLYRPISVNVSKINMYNPQIAEILLDLVNRYDVDPAYFNLELTESAYTENPDMISNSVDRLRDYGFKVYMDDFGKGYSSLNVLKDMKVDALKMDMRFLGQTDMPERSEKIMISIIGMTQAIEVDSVAEGVENREQADFLGDIGCGYAQGYFFSRPLPCEEYELLMQREGQQYVS